jgi:Leucine-rich repeat (LRR) protein
MTDRDILAALERRIGRPFAYTLEGDRCVALDLTSEHYLFRGLIRRHPAAEKREIMELVSRLIGLRTLNLRRNKLLSLPDSFQNLRAVEHLNLGSNYLGHVPGQIRGFSRLTYLHLGNNEIAELPPWMEDFARLEYLALHKHLRLRSVDALAGQKRLKTLNLYLVNLGRMPRFMYELTTLVSLTLWNVSDLSDEIARLTNLEFFTDCGAPGLHRLPDGFTKLKKLRMTRLYQNQLEKLPDDFGDLENLEQVSLYQNRLSQLPHSMARLKKLAKLNLGWNSFETLPPWLSELPSLEWLGVFENPLRNCDAVTVPPAARVAREWPLTTLHA